MKLSEILSERTRLWSPVKLDDLDLWRRMSVDNETKVAELKRIYRRIQAADHPMLTLPVEMTLAMAEMTALLDD